MTDTFHSSGLILGLETSTHSGGAALLRSGGELVGSVSFSTRQLYSQRLLPSIQWLLERTQTAMTDIGVVGISIGPGSFTGLRIGLSVAKALAYASGAKIIGVGTLEALAVRASGGRDGLVCPLLDARHGQVYAGLFQVTWQRGLPRVEAIHPDWAGPIADVAGWISGPTVFAGDATALATEHLAPVLKDNFLAAPAHHSLPHPEDVAVLTAARAAAGAFDDPVALEPHYVRQTYTSRGAAKT
jgi:tRNA threonylcarbamoyladenosine biosynthesis protein TsaB